MSRIKKYDCVSFYFIGCYRRKDRRKKYKEMLADSDAKINEYLDLKRVIEHQEFLQTALNVLLSHRQAKIVKQISLTNMTLL